MTELNEKTHMRGTAQEELRVSEMRYRRLFEAARDGILILDVVTCKITDVNPYMVELLGYSHEEFIGKELFEIGLLEDAAASRELHDELRESGYFRYEDLSLQTRSGKRCEVEFVGNVYEENGHEVIQCNIRDITQRRRDYQESARLAAIVESSDDAIISKTLDGVITSWNAGAQRLYGYSAEEAIGRLVSFLAPPSLPDEMPQLLEKIRRGEPVQHYETERVCKDGSRIDISLSISPLRNAAGKVIGATSIKRDITQRKLAEQELRLHSKLLGVVGQAVIATNPAGKITYWNDFAEKLYGWPASEVLGRNILNVTPASATQAQAAEILACLARGESWAGEFIAQRRAGTTFPTYLTNTPILDAAGHVSGIIGLSLDISVRKRNETALQESQRFLQSTLDALASHIAVLDENCNLIAVNRAWRQFSADNEGAPASCEVGANYLQAFEPASGVQTEEGAAVTGGIRAVVSGQQQHFCLEYPSHNTTEKRWFCVNVTRFADDCPMRVVVTHENITQRKQAELNLEQMRRQYELIFNAVGEGIHGFDRRGRITFENPASVRMFGCEARDLLGLPAHETIHHSKPDGTYYPKSDCPIYATLHDGITRSVSTDVFWRTDGSSFPVEYTSTPIRNERDEIDGVVVSFRDITERRQAEAEDMRLQARMEEQRLRLDTIVASVPGVVWESWSRPDASLQHVDFVSHHVEAMMGYTVAEWLATPNFWLTLVHPEDRERAEQEGVAIYSGGHGGTSQFRWIAKDGHQVWAESQMVVICDDAGHPCGLRGVTMDITERMRAEEAQQRQQAELRVLFDLMPAMIWFKDTQNGILRVNQRVADAAGKSVEEIEGKPSPEIYPQEAAKFYADDLEVIHAGVPRLGIVETMYGPAGKQLWIQTDKVPVCDKAGKPIGIVVMAQDITERKRAEALLVKSQQRLALATEAARIGIWDWDVVADELVWDAQMYVLYGIRRQDFGGAYSAWQNGLHPEDRARADADMTAALAGSRDFRPQYRVVWPNGEIRHIEAHAVVVRASDGSARNVIGVNWDITERKEAETALQKMHDELEGRVEERTAELARANVALQEKEAEQKRIMDTLALSEERFRLLVESVHDYAILMLDTTGHILTWNAGAEHLNGYQAEEIIGQHFSRFYTAEDRRVNKPEKELLTATSEGYLDDEGWRVRKDGSHFWATVVLTPMYDDSGHLRGFAKITRDITERKNIEAALHEAKAQADSANLAKSDFLSRMSHELRTPLNAILGFGQILEMRHPPDDLDGDGEAIVHILKGGRHLLGLINEVLDIASIEAGRSSLSPEPIAVSRTVCEVLDMVRPLAATRQIRLVNQVGAQDERHVCADLQRLRQILLNLLANAIKYNCDAGQVTISCEANGEFLRLNVLDTGPGLTLAEQAKLFIPFERLHAANSQIEGTGLGLMLCKTLVEAMEGRIGVDSAPGQGSTFWVEFPLVESQMAQLEHSSDRIVSPGELPTGVPAGEQRTVLYIEDNLSNFKVIESLLRNRPEIKLLSAMQGSIGLDLARQHVPDLILLDLHLPDITGEVVLSRLRADSVTQHIPVVVLSADATAEKISNLHAMGIEHYLTKPINLREFIQVLDGILKRDSESRLHH